MKNSLDDTFKNNLEIQCEKFIKWYLDIKCGTNSDRDLFKANCHFNKLYPEYELYCKAEEIEKMTEGQFNIFCSKAIKILGYKTIQKKNENKLGYIYVLFSEEV